jgi:hypothetical protein
VLFQSYFAVDPHFCSLPQQFMQSYKHPVGFFRLFPYLSALMVKNNGYPNNMKRICYILIFFSMMQPLLSQVEENNIIHISGPDALRELTDGRFGKADSLIANAYLLLSTLSNFDSSAIASYDKILTYSHEVYIAKIENITPSFVLFLYPFNTELQSLNRNNISQIQYADGTIDIFLPLTNKTGFDKEVVDTSRIIIRSRRDWEKVTLTNKSEDITGMVEKGKIIASYQADYVNAENEYLEKNAQIILRKKAANLNAPVVLLINRNFHKAYGDFPSIELEGILYAYQ